MPDMTPTDEISDDALLDLEGDLGVGKLLDVYTNYADDPLGVVTYVCSFGEGVDVTHADRHEGGFTQDKDAIRAAMAGTAPSVR